MALLRFDDGQQVEITQSEQGIVTITVMQWDGTFLSLFLDKEQAEELGGFLLMFVEQ